MDNVITITNTKDNYISFNINVEGVDPNDMDVKFVIEAKDMCVSFECVEHTNGKWEVTIPSIPFIERTTYPFHIEVVVDGYYFEPCKGMVDVIGPTDIYISKPENTTIKPKTSSESNVYSNKVATEGKENDYYHKEKERIDDLANAIIKQAKELDVEPEYDTDDDKDDDKDGFLEPGKGKSDKNDEENNSSDEKDNEEKMQAKNHSTSKKDDLVREALRGVSKERRNNKPLFKKGKVVSR